ncbi:hypothetical protein Chor_004729 [Crotalus horridus]
MVVTLLDRQKEILLGCGWEGSLPERNTASRTFGGEALFSALERFGSSEYFRESIMAILESSEGKPQEKRSGRQILKWRACVGIKDHLVSSDPAAHHNVTLGSTLRNYYYITILRDPVSRYLSEWRHVQRGATWKASLHVCDGRSPTSEELPSCYSGDDWSGCSLQEFMDCPYNLANNRQVRMLADLSLVGCYNLSVMPEEQRNQVLLDSAKENLKRMAFFGLTEFQRKTQYLFEKTFNMNFISPFTQYNSTRASSVDIDEATQQQIEALNFLDMDLYDYAKDLFLQRVPVHETEGAPGSPPEAAGAAEELAGQAGPQ